MLRLLVINTCLLALLSSCGGTFSYKRGARPEALNTAQTGCNSAGKQDKKAMEQCLEAQGWSVYQFDDVDLFAEASESTEANGGRKVDSAFVTVEENNKTEIVQAKTAPEPAAAHPNKTATKTKPNSEKTSSVSTKEIATKTSEPKPSLYKVYKVSSWWQWGAGQQTLARDLAACESSLGEKHKPDFSKQLVTRGFVVCMYKKGWKALKSK